MIVAASALRHHSPLAEEPQPDRVNRYRFLEPQDDLDNRQIGQVLAMKADRINRFAATAILFGRFRLFKHRRELLADGVPVPIGSRALDVLIVLIEARGELVTKDELLSRVWPGTVVEENTLQFQVSTLRKALGPDRGFIKTSSGRGYRFIAEIKISAGQERASSDSTTSSVARSLPSTPPTNLPAPMSDLIGREAQLSCIADLVAAHRLVTLVGAGGVGKTRLGIEFGRRLLPKFADGVWVVELGRLSDPELVLPTVAAVLGLAGGSPSPERLAMAVASKHLLLVLDNCEHVIDAATRITEAFLHASATVQVIATSREPLRVEGECVYPVPSLDVPAEGTRDIEELSQNSAARLFIERARAAEPRLTLDARVGAATAAICRRLDGIPLAIELAASRAAALGIEELAAGLDEPFDLLAGGRRTALPRHQTLRATLDWSYELLAETERVVLRRLAIFAGGFGLEAANAIAVSPEIAAAAVVDGVATLVAKSLVTADVDGAIMRYRLLETTRAYMLERLTDSGERDEIERRHGEYYRNPFQRAAVDSEIRPVAERLITYGPDIDNVRAARPPLQS
jgi:predicted ATPase/DNA-binding winged helix-turn-helix (wHTH) protein